MARPIVHPLQEILSKDINQLRKNADITLLDVVLGNALPKLPAFIGGGFKAKISGNDVVVEPGVAFQTIPQTDGSANTRIAHLTAEETLTINLPSAGQTKRDLIECRSVIVNNPTESRKFSQLSGVVDRNVIVSNKWSAEIRVKENVTANAQGGYDASEGWVAVAIVNSNDTGVVSIVDHRNFYNLFDPDFFSVYGRRNVGFLRKYDGVNLVEVPFAFSDLTPKLGQVSVRRFTKERYGVVTTTNRFPKDFTWNKPQNTQSYIGGLFLNNNIGVIGSTRSQNFTRYNSQIGPYRTYTFNTNQFNAGIRMFIGSDLYLGFETTDSGVNRIVLLFSGDGNSTGWGGSSGNVFIILSTSQNINLNNIAIYPMLKGHIKNRSSRYYHWGFNSGQSGGHPLYIQTMNYRGFAPSYKGNNFSLQNKMYVTLVDSRSPLSQSVDPSYNLPSELSISNYYSLKDVIFNTDTNVLSVILKNANSLTVSDGDLFEYFIIKKGNETRLRKNFQDNNNLVVNDDDDDELKIDWQLTNEEVNNLIKSDDTSFNDMNIEFFDVDSTGEDIWRANQLRGGSALSNNVDFVLVIEELRTYVRLNPSFPFKEDDDLLFSHIIPQELIDAGSGGSPEDQTAEAQITALRNQLNTLSRQVTTNTGDISTLENASQAGDVTFYYGIIAIPGGRTRTARTNAKSTSYLTPLATAQMNNPTSRTAKTISSLLLSGGLVAYNASATVGYYTPWFAIETADIGSNSVRIEGAGGDETALWSPLGSLTLNSKAYTIYGRTTPIINAKTLRVVVKLFE